MKVFLRCACGTRDSRARGCTHKWASQFKYRGAVVPLQTPHINKADAVAEAIRQRDTWIKRAKGLPVDDDDQPRGGQSLATLQAAFLHGVRGSITPDTLHAYTRITGVFVAIVGATKLVHTLTPFDINRWRTVRTDGGDGRRPVSRATVNSELIPVQRMFTWGGLAARLFGDHVTVNGATVPGVTKWKDQKHVPKHRPLTRDELTRAWTQLPEPYDLISRITYETLARLTEVLRLQRQHVGTSRTADGDLVGWMIRLLKGGRTRRSTLPLALAHTLMARTPDPDAYLFADLLDLTASWKWNQKTVSRRYRQLFDRIGLSCSHHSFKHSGVTAMLDRGESDLAIVQHAGWTTPKMLPTYGHVDDPSARRAVDGNAKEAAAILAGITRDPLVVRRRSSGER